MHTNGSGNKLEAHGMSFDLKTSHHHGSLGLPKEGKQAKAALKTVQ